MCNRTDCAGVWAGELACRRCQERDMEMTELSHNMRQALIDLDAPYCDASVYWTKNTMAALEKRGLVFRRDNGITWSWEVTPEGRTFLKESGTSGCATCDDLWAENAALRDRVEALERLVAAHDNYLTMADNIAEFGKTPENLENLQAAYDRRAAAREAIK